MAPREKVPERLFSSIKKISRQQRRKNNEPMKNNETFFEKERPFHFLRQSNSFLIGSHGELWQWTLKFQLGAPVMDNFLHRHKMDIVSHVAWLSLMLIHYQK